ncbi:MAG: TRAP transporter permease, partial [Betaproteobacteria bacterium]
KALVPFMFVYTPSLLFLQFEWPAFASALFCGAVGIIALSAAYIGHFRASLDRWEKALLTIAGLVLVFNNLWANLAGVAVVFALLGANALRARRHAH